MLEDDESYLNEKGYDWSVQQDASHGNCLVIKDFPINFEKFSVNKTDLLVIIPPQYNNVALDMFYVKPEVKLKDGQYPQAADQSFNCLGEIWQRFSRHITNWQPGLDAIHSFLSLVKKEFG